MVFRPLTGKISPALPSAIDEGFWVFAHALLLRIYVATTMRAETAPYTIKVATSFAVPSWRKLPADILLLDGHRGLLLNDHLLRLLLLVNPLRGSRTNSTTANPEAFVVLVTGLHIACLICKRHSTTSQNQ